jgi:hypothetical protein
VSVVWHMAEKELEWSGMLAHVAWASIQEIGSCGECVRPERGWGGSMVRSECSARPFYWGVYEHVSQRSMPWETRTE